MSLIAKWRFALDLSRDHQLSRADLALGLLLLEKYNDAKGFAWPSLDWLAAEAHVDRSTATRSINRLIVFGYFQRTSGGGRGRASHYRPCFLEAKNGRKYAPFPGEKRVRRRTETEASAHENSCTGARKQVHRRATSTLRNEFNKSSKERGARSEENDFVIGKKKTMAHKPNNETSSSYHRVRLHDTAPSQGNGVARPRTGNKRPLNLTEWQPSAETAAWASEHAGKVDDPLGRVAEKFRNYYLARGRSFIDPDAAFRKWLADEQEHAVQRQTRGDQGRSEILSRAMRAADAAHGGKS
jgi:hypothetical protein